MFNSKKYRNFRKIPIDSSGSLLLDLFQQNCYNVVFVFEIKRIQQLTNIRATINHFKQLRERGDQNEHSFETPSKYINMYKVWVRYIICTNILFHFCLKRVAVNFKVVPVVVDCLRLYMLMVGPIRMLTTDRKTSMKLPTFW